MSVECDGRRTGQPKCFPSADFKIFPISFASNSGQTIDDRFRFTFTKYKRFAEISKGKANTAAARNRAPHLHEWHQRHRFATPNEVEVKGGITVSFNEYLGPGRS